METKKDIVKSTSILGGAHVFILLLGLVKNKILAYFLGPTGFGLISTFQSTTNLVQNFSGFGIASSSIRSIAQSNADQNNKRISSTILTTRILILLAALIGAIISFIPSSHISNLTFGTDKYSWEIQILSLSVFFNVILSGQKAVLQGLREIKKLAILSIWGAILGLILSTPIIYFYRFEGIPVVLISLSISNYLIALWYIRKLTFPKPNLNLLNFLKEAKEMLLLGSSFFLGGILTAATFYYLRIYIIDKFGLEAVGIYQAASVLSLMYINIVLQAMSKDFYPKLVAIAFDEKKEVELINYQIEVGIWLATPGLLITMVLSPYLIDILYSSSFEAAYPILQWLLFGIMIKTISWPLGYFFIARGKGKLFFLIQLIASISNILFFMLCTNYFGLIGIGYAEILMNLVLLVFCIALINSEIDFVWHKNTILSGLFVSGSLVIIRFTMVFIDSDILALIIGLTLTLIFSLYSCNKILLILNLTLKDIATKFKR